MQPTISRVRNFITAPSISKWERSGGFPMHGRRPILTPSMEDRSRRPISDGKFAGELLKSPLGRDPLDHLDHLDHLGVKITGRSSEGAPQRLEGPPHLFQEDPQLLVESLRLRRGDPPPPETGTGMGSGARDDAVSLSSSSFPP